LIVRTLQEAKTFARENSSDNVTDVVARVRA
jgi:hypothetical protein